MKEIKNLKEKKGWLLRVPLPSTVLSIDGMHPRPWNRSNKNTSVEKSKRKQEQRKRKKKKAKYRQAGQVAEARQGKKTSERMGSVYDVWCEEKGVDNRQITTGVKKDAVL